MRHAVIVGNAGAARECYWLLEDMRKADASMECALRFRGFLSWQGYAGDLKSLSDLQLGDAAHYTPQPDDVFVIGMGDPTLRKNVYELLHAKGLEFLTLRHPLADINPHARVGEANIFQRNSTVFCDAVLGNANYLNGAVNVSHDAMVGDYNFFGPFSLVLGNAQVGSGNSIAARCTILPKARIGNGNILAPGSVVYKGCKNGCRLAGNPALTIGHVHPEQSL